MGLQCRQCSLGCAVHPALALRLIDPFTSCLSALTGEGSPAMLTGFPWLKEQGVLGWGSLPTFHLLAQWFSVLPSAVTL